MNVSYEGIGQWAATFACDGVSAGQVVKVSAGGTVALVFMGEILNKTGKTMRDITSIIGFGQYE